MRKIINGKSYDTETAQLVGSTSNGLSYRDFGYVCESLHRKRTGEYFLHGEGGAMTRYAERIDGNSWSGGEMITPMAYEAARKWAEENLAVDEYEREFGIVDDDADEVVMTVRVTATVKAAIDREVARTGETRGQVMERLVAAL